MNSLRDWFELLDKYITYFYACNKNLQLHNTIN